MVSPPPSCPRRPLGDFSFPWLAQPQDPTHRARGGIQFQAAGSRRTPGATESRGPGDPEGSRSSGEAPPEAEEAGAGGGEVVGVGGGGGDGWGVCDDNPVEAGGAAPRLPDPIPAQVNPRPHFHPSPNPTETVKPA